MPSDEKIVVQSIHRPGGTRRVNAAKYQAMREVLLRVLPKEPPGLTQAEMGTAVLPHLPQALWPNGGKSMWWVKTVQLDLEAKGMVLRSEKGRPTRWRRA